MKKEYQATNYKSDLTDKQWEAIKEFFPFGNKSKYHKRSFVEAVLYIVKTGCQWNDSRRLSKDYETSCCSAETMIMISHAATLLNRL